MEFWLIVAASERFQGDTIENEEFDRQCHAAIGDLWYSEEASCSDNI